jgi:hypothetical protein
MIPLPYPWRIGAVMLLALYLPNALDGGADPRQWGAGLWLWWLVPWCVWLVGAFAIRAQILRNRRANAEFMAAMDALDKTFAKILEQQAEQRNRRP